MLYEGRRDRLRQRLSGEGLRAWVATDLSDIRYLTGFSGSNAVLVLGCDPGDDLLGTDGRYQDHIAQQCPSLPAVIDRNTFAVVAQRVSGWSLAVNDVVTVAQAAMLPASARIEPSWVREFRAVKDSDEISVLTRAAQITADAFEALAAEIRVGDTELALARRLEQLFGAGGAEDRAFATIVASGANSAIPHHAPTTKALEPGDLLVIDAGARVDGYCSDMTRTYVVGKNPEGWQSELHASTLKAQQKAALACSSGMQAKELYAIARDVIDEAGFAGRFTHGLGHGVGIDIHEAPMLGPYATGRIADAMTITVEPGIYLPGRGGVRIEDTLAVTASGPMVLTEAPRDLRVVG